MGEITLDLTPVDATFGAIIRDVALRSLDASSFQAIYRAWLEYALLIFPGQYLTREEQNEFALRFGALEFAATAISNIDKNGQVRFRDGDEVVKALRGNEGWHHDSPRCRCKRRAPYSPPRSCPPRVPRPVGRIWRLPTMRSTRRPANG